jgi:hypothetical protein
LGGTETLMRLRSPMITSVVEAEQDRMAVLRKCPSRRRSSRPFARAKLCQLLSIHRPARDLRVPATRVAEIVRERCSIAFDTALRRARWFTPERAF